SALECDVREMRTPFSGPAEYGRRHVNRCYGPRPRVQFHRKVTFGASDLERCSHETARNHLLNVRTLRTLVHIVVRPGIGSGKERVPKLRSPLTGQRRAFGRKGHGYVSTSKNAPDGTSGHSSRS